MYRQRDPIRPLRDASVHAPASDRRVELASRVFAVLGVAAIAVIHILNSQDAYTSAHYIFWMYLAVIVAAVPVVTLLLHWGSPLVWVATTVLAAGPLVGYLWSRKRRASKRPG